MGECFTRNMQSCLQGIKYCTKSVILLEHFYVYFQLLSVWRKTSTQGVICVLFSVGEIVLSVQEIHLQKYL
jgi:hypothetical protein